MKKLKNWSMLMLMVMALPLMVSCGGDDEGDNNLVNGSNKGKRISMIVEEHGSTIAESVFAYDDQNRIVKVVTNEKDDTPHNSTSTYVYGETFIKAKKVVKSTNRNHITSTTEYNYVYTLSNGIITEMSLKTTDNYTSTTKFIYDSNKYLVKSGDGTTLEWSSGNLFSIETLSSIISVPLKWDEFKY